MRSAESHWDFWTLLPEVLHQITIVMSDRGIPKSYRHMHVFGRHTFSLINAKNERSWVKFHLKTQQDIQNMTNEEATARVGQGRESSQADLLNAIDNKDFPRWNLQIQIMPEKDAATYHLNLFGLTRNPENGHAEVEQLAFSPDKMPQSRLFSYMTSPACAFFMGTAKPPERMISHPSYPENQETRKPDHAHTLPCPGVDRPA